MISVLGFRRIGLIAGLIALNGLLAMAVYTLMLPQQEAQERALRTLRGEVSTLRSDIARMEIEFEQLEDQKAEFKKLEADGFFKNQSRRQAENTFSAIQKKSGIAAAVASIDAGVVEDNTEAAKAQYKILRSPVQVKMEAVDDVDVYHYLFLIEHYFPGHMSVGSLKIRREADVSGVVLRSIAAGENPPLVKAEAEMVWRTMIPESAVIGAEENKTGGAQ